MRIIFIEYHRAWFRIGADLKSKSIVVQELKNIRVVLIEPSHPGNIGATARSMKTMGLNNLILVEPKKFPHYEASKRAAGAEDVLASATVVNNVHAAIADCTMVLGTSVRDREVTWPTLDPRAAAMNVIDHLAMCDSVDQGQPHQVAILFGRESSGMSNEEMDLCDYQIRIPANSDYSSLNLASAVQIIAYEMRISNLQKSTPMAEPYSSADISPALQRRIAATSAQKLGHLEHLKATLEELEFIKSKPSTVLMRKLTKLYSKAELSVEEVQILRGILTAIQTKLSRS